MIDYDKILCSRIKQVQPSGIRKYFDLLQGMEGGISLGIGEPDFVTPWHIRDAGIYSLEKGFTKYSPNAGLTDLRQAISQYLKRRFDLSYEGIGQILVTVGGSEGLDLAFRCLLEPGDEVIIPSPSFVCYGPLVSMLHAVPVMVETKAVNEFRLPPNVCYLWQRNCKPPLPPKPGQWCCLSPITPPEASWAGRIWRPWRMCCGARISW